MLLKEGSTGGQFVEDPFDPQLKPQRIGQCRTTAEVLTLREQRLQGGEKGVGDRVKWSREKAHRVENIFLQSRQYKTRTIARKHPTKRSMSHNVGVRTPTGSQGQEQRTH